MLAATRAAARTAATATATATAAAAVRRGRVGGGADGVASAATRRAYSVGQALTACEFVSLRDCNGAARSMASVFGGRRVVVVGTPAAFSSVCSESHVPQYVRALPQLRAAGADELAVVSVNDHYVMSAWRERIDPSGVASFYADADGLFAHMLGVERDLSGGGLGVRSTRYSLVVDDGRVHYQNVEQNPGEVTVSGVDTLLSQIGVHPRDALDADMAEAVADGDLEHTLRLFWQHQYDGLRPSAEAHLNVMRAYAANGDVDGAERFYGMLCDDVGGEARLAREHADTAHAIVARAAAAASSA